MLLWSRTADKRFRIAPGVRSAGRTEPTELALVLRLGALGAMNATPLRATAGSQSPPTSRVTVERDHRLLSEGPCNQLRAAGSHPDAAHLEHPSAPHCVQDQSGTAKPTRDLASLVATHHATLQGALEDGSQIGGLTHNFYHYPARFAPRVARALIEAFSQPGNWVLDCFMGGGTSIVEGLSTGRRMIGVDLNSLAHFISEARTTPLTSPDVREIRSWASTVADCFAHTRVDWVVAPGIKNFPEPLETLTAAAIDMATELGHPRRVAFARAVLLRLGQWAMESRERVSFSARQLSTRVPLLTDELLEGSAAFGAAVDEWAAQGAFKTRKRLLNRSVVGLSDDPALADLHGKVRCVVTSPPYPGVHVLYHRWQLFGRKETRAPYWVAAAQDGHGEAYYTLGGRSRAGVERYYETLCDAYTSVRPLLTPDALVAQIVAFPDPAVHLPRYLDAMRAAGYEEVGEQERIWRSVPNRRWYLRIRKDAARSSAGQEVLLLHRPLGGVP
jgi:hypothetical protein